MNGPVLTARVVESRVVGGDKGESPMRSSSDSPTAPSTSTGLQARADHEVRSQGVQKLSDDEQVNEETCQVTAAASPAPWKSWAATHPSDLP